MSGRRSGGLTPKDLLNDDVPVDLWQEVTVSCAGCRQHILAADAWIDRHNPYRAFCDPCFYSRFGRQPRLPLHLPSH